MRSNSQFALSPLNRLETSISKGRAHSLSKSSEDQTLASNGAVLQQLNRGNEPSLKNPIKGLVSRNKRRFDWDGYNLDLTYITKNILAMGFPSENLQAIYRNPLEEVEKFLQERHRNHYKVYNLCKEKHYSGSKFDGNFVQYPFEDHNAPPFELIYKCLLDMKNWLSEDQENIVAIHCKAGKGRTGVIIGCCLLYLGMFGTAEQCMEHYSNIRTVDGKGVTIPSQIRYIKYFEEALKRGWVVEQNYRIQKRSVMITSVKMSHCPQFSMFGGCTPWISVITKDREFRSKYSHPLVRYQTDQAVVLTFKMPFAVEQDFKIVFFTKGWILNKSEQIMRVWLNCLFLPNNGAVQLTFNDLDGIKGADARFNKDFSLQVSYDQV